MAKATVRGKYESAKSCGSAALSFSAADVKIGASMTNATGPSGSSLNGLVLSLDKPGSFLVNYNVPKQDFRFQFMNAIKVLDKPLQLSYAHALGDNLTTLDATLSLNCSNKVSANYAFASKNCKVKYIFIHGEGSRTFEPCYDFSKDAWDFQISQRVFEDDTIRASYQTSTKILGLEWSKNHKMAGSFKISASLNMAEDKFPKVTAESMWNFNI